jgi:mannose-1-phosphate guanylyltransferase
MVTEATVNMAQSKDVYFVLLAGGNGERLWPLSRQEKPKQLLTVAGDKTLLEQALDRIVPLAHSKENIWVSTTPHHEKSIHACLRDRVGNIVVEPGLRDTGPAILYCCMELYKHNPNAVVIFLAADAFIPKDNYHKFQHTVMHGTLFAQENDAIVLFGVKPTFPATGYGYIEYDQHNLDMQSGAFKVVCFHEKPSQAVAHYYMDLDNMLWNIGMFGGNVSTFIKEFERSAPDIFKGVQAAFEGTGSYNDIKKISIDYAVLEKSSHVWVVPTDINWCDVGNIGVLLELQKEHNSLSPNTIALGAHNNLVQSKTLAVLIGVDDLCVVQTDDVLLITKKEDAERVKAIVGQLKQQDNLTGYL